MKLRHSFFHRGLAKAQTILLGKLMKVQQGPVSLGEDIHLRHYTPAQLAAEEALADKNQHPASRNLRPIRVLAVIPFRDKWEMTERCLEGFLAQKLDGLQVLVALVDNGSVETETAEGIINAMARLKKAGIQSRHLRYDIPFNYSYLNNQAHKDCADFNAEILGLINNDIEFLENDSVHRLVVGCELPRAGAVGCTLLYPDGLIQHLFVFVGSKIVGSHPYKGKVLQLQSRWYQKPRAVGAVTGAVMFMKVEHFRKAGGFDEKLPTSYQDVDLCLTFQKMGLVNWTLPHVLLLHHETQTRSKAASWDEAYYTESKWGDFLLKNPFVSDVWSRKSEHFVYTPSAWLKSLFTKNL